MFSSNFRLRALQMGGSQGSSMALYHPIHYSDEYATFDTEFREKCCSSGLCNVFHERRPIDNSTDYIPPSFGEQDIAIGYQYMVFFHLVTGMCHNTFYPCNYSRICLWRPTLHYI